MLFLTDQERDQLKAQHKPERDGRVRDRIKAVLLSDEGWTPQQIAKVLLISDQAVREHVHEYKASHKLKPAFGWIKTGVRKEIPANTGRERINLSGMIDMIQHQVIIHEDKTLNAETTIQFVRKIEEAYPTKNKIHIFCDNAPYYRNKAVSKYLETSRVKLHFLPPYSPNLNPIERLWKWMKERIIYNTYYEHFEEFKAAVMGFFAILSVVSEESILGRMFRSRVRDRFSPISSLVKA